uniref:Uncharacterized protein n=1 Tax=Biomphalaria glabrata TaxID=6526 RepID=A0A2C9KQY0_BIOGL
MDQDNCSSRCTELSKGQQRITHLYEFHLNGKHENEVAESEEADLQKHIVNCKKNPGHTNFIPYELFAIDHIPESHRDSDMFELIKVVADLTVLVTVKTISKNRPEFWPGSTMKYPFYEDKGSKIIRFGSGQVNEVIQFTEGLGYDRHQKKREREYKTCICEKCQYSEKPSPAWWEIVVRTASHVVYDETESELTSCRLFFDKHKSAEKVKFDKVKLLEVNVDEDWCLISYVFCGNDFAYRDKLFNKVMQRVDLWKKVCQKYQDSGDNFTFIVSHPHGCAKQISFGLCKNSIVLGKFDDQLDRAKIEYDTPTCPGSSGAPVRCVGLAVGHVHNGTMEGINYSGVSLVFRDGSPYVK